MDYYTMLTNSLDHFCLNCVAYISIQYNFSNAQLTQVVYDKDVYLLSQLLISHNSQNANEMNPAPGHQLNTSYATPSSADLLLLNQKRIFCLLAGNPLAPSCRLNSLLAAAESMKRLTPHLSASLPARDCVVLRTSLSYHAATHKPANQISSALKKCVLLLQSNRLESREESSSL